MMTSAAMALPRRLKHLSATISLWSERLRKHQTARLAVGLAFFVSLIPGSLSQNPRAEWLYPLPFFIVFMFLVFRTRAIANYVARLERWYEFLGRQQRRSLGQASGQNYKLVAELAEGFPLVRDIGLVGPHSLWTLVDETLSEGGRRELLRWMSAPTLEAGVLLKRQELLQRLRADTWFYSRLCVETNTEELGVSSTQIQEFLRTSVVGSGFMGVLAVNLLVWLGTIATAVWCDAHGMALPGWALLVFPLVSLSSLGVAGAAFRSGVGLAHHLGALTPVFAAIEKRSRRSPALMEVCRHIAQFSPSRSARRLDFIMTFVGTQTNPILHFILNAFLPWTVASVFFFERLRRKISADFPVCLSELAELEVYGSLLVLTHYQTRTFPQFAASGIALECRQIFHPLLDRAKAVANDFSFVPGQSLGLLTGSNMSGKSTFLRTIGINQTLANMGAPVFASAMMTVPLKVETCIEVTDSLRDGYSYFYAEVRKLRQILGVAASGVPVLYLIDEIFRGTNNRERQLGSQAVIRTLAGEKRALGFISTHDLELTTLEQTNPSVVNLHFREDLTSDGKMNFHYHLRHGPSPTTNALIIMKAEGIPVEDA